MRRGALSRWNLVLERLSDRLGRSSRVFLIGLVVACGIEVAVDWSSTLGEINVLRGSLEQKGEDYVDILRRAAQPAVAAYDWVALDELSRGLFDDPDVVYVRFSDALGNTLQDRLRADYGAAFARKHGGVGFRDYYRHQIDRDCGGMLSDPLALRARIAQSRHRDFIQAFNDAENRVLARFVAPAPQKIPTPHVIYQDRLYDAAHRFDTSLSYALGAIVTERGDATGVALIALRHDRTNRAVAGKLLKGLGITLFFVCLILVQNVLARRAKLRLLALEAALSSARAAIGAAAPKVPAYDAAEIGVAFAQAEGLGGTVYDLTAQPDGSVELLLAVPHGAGVDAAFASVVLRDLYRRQGGAESPAARVQRLLADYDEAPLGRDVELLCARFGPDGAVHGVVAGLRAPTLIDDRGAPRAVTLGAPLPVTARRLAAELRPFSASLDDGVFAIFDDGLPAGAPRRFPIERALDRIAERLTQRRADAQTIADEAVAEAVKRWRKRNRDDLFALLVRRRARGRA